MNYYKTLELLASIITLLEDYHRLGLTGKPIPKHDLDQMTITLKPLEEVRDMAKSLMRHIN